MKTAANMTATWGVLLVVLLTLTACSTLTTAAPDPFTTLPYRHKAYDLAFAWSAHRQGNELMLQGVLKNEKYPAIEGLDITLELQEAGGKTIRKAHTFVIPSSISLDQNAAFDIKISLAGASPEAKLRLIYFYTSVEVGRFGSQSQLGSFGIDQFGRYLAHPPEIPR